MKSDIVTQWVRGMRHFPQVPPAQSLANRAVVNLTCIVGNGGCEAEGNESIGHVTEPRKLYIRGQWIALSKSVKSTHYSLREDSSPETIMAGSGTPPGSVRTNMACDQRGSFGTWEDRYSHCSNHRRSGEPVEQNTAARIDDHQYIMREPARGHETTGGTVYRGTSGSEVIRDGISVVLAEHSSESEVE